MPKFRISVLRIKCRENAHFSIAMTPFLPTRNHEEPDFLTAGRAVRQSTRSQCGSALATYSAPVAHHQHHDHKPPIRKILLIARVFVRGDDRSETFNFRSAQELAVLQSMPSALNCGGDLVIAQGMAKRNRCTLIKQNLQVMLICCFEASLSALDGGINLFAPDSWEPIEESSTVASIGLAGGFVRRLIQSVGYCPATMIQTKSSAPRIDSIHLKSDGRYASAPLSTRYFDSCSLGERPPP